MTGRVARSLPGLLLVSAAAVLLSFWMVADVDVFFHLKTGQVILETGALPRENLFSSTFPHYPWPNPEALFQVLLALIHRTAGWEGIQVLKVLFVVAIAALLFARLRRRGLGQLEAAFWTITPLAIMQVRFTERPQLASYLFFAVTLLLLDIARSGRGRVLWALPPLFALWSNIHPEFILGLLLIAGVATGEILNRSAGRKGPFLGVRRLLQVGLASTAATALNPEGFQALAYPFLHLFLGPTVAVIEYLPTSPLRYPLYYAWLGALPFLTVPRPRRDWELILPALGLGLLGILYQREIPYLLILTAPVFAERLCGSAATTPVLGRRAALVSLLAVSVALAWALGFDRLQPYRWGWGVDERRFPAAAADLLLREPWQGVLYNEFGDGGYLIYRLFPRFGVFQDGRIPAYPRAFMARLNSGFSPSDWPAILADYHVDLALLPIIRTGGGFPPQEWGLVFWDDRWCVMARRTKAHLEPLQRHEYRYFRPGANLDAIQDPARLEALAGEMLRNQRERRLPSRALAADLAEVLRKLGRRDEARALLDQLELPREPRANSKDASLRSPLGAPQP